MRVYGHNRDWGGGTRDLGADDEEGSVSPLCPDIPENCAGVGLLDFLGLVPDSAGHCVFPLCVRKRSP